jgi:DNA recombination protein RmuC
MIGLEFIVIGVLATSFLVMWAWMHRQKGQLEQSFKALSLDALEQSSKTFLQLAETHLEKYQEGAKAELKGREEAISATLEPLKTAIHALDMQHRELEKRREGAYGALSTQLAQMLRSDTELRQETAQLASALKTPHVRGSWGEVHLRRVVELAGLINHCDFLEQVSMEGDDRGLRPDLLVRLPGERHIVVDSKVPLTAYLDAQAQPTEVEHAKKLKDHALALRKHIKDLSAKEYWKRLARSPEYVILFLPAEAFFSAALQADPSLIEVGADQNVVIATPTTLIAILRAIAFGWKQEGLSKSAADIAKAGAELYERLSILSEHWNKVGRQLETVVGSYNDSISSIEHRLLPSARKLKEFSGLTKELKAPEPIEKLVRASKDL